jgi:HK97 gp10 family phage protein
VKISASTTGGEQVIKNLQKYGSEKEKRVQGAIDLTAQLVRTDAIRSMKSSPASGDTYKRRTVSHTASSTPNPPRIDTGRLANSIKALVGKLEAFVGTNVKYGPHLEFGTRNMDPRPWLFPAFERQRRNFLNRLKEAMR